MGEIDFKLLRDKAGPYPPQAYVFVREGLAHTVKMIHGGRAAAATGEEGEGTDSRHVSGQQLCLGLRDYAVRQYGKLAKTVLDNWHIHRTDDFGKIVFALIEAEELRKTDQDSIDDFRSVYDFEEAFGDLQKSS